MAPERPPERFPVRGEKEKKGDEDDDGSHDGPDHHCFVRGKFLGRGGFASVYACRRRHRRENDDDGNEEEFAVKAIAKSSLTKPRNKRKVQSEIKIHRALDHPGIVRVEDVFEDDGFLYILLERCADDTLLSVVQRRKRLPEDEALAYFRQLLDVCAYLKKNRVIHRDLKLGNIFLDRSDPRKIKLGDFGLATQLTRDGERRRTLCGTPNYIAPEVLDGSYSDGHDFAADLWSLGVILYTMLFGKPPFQKKEVTATYKCIQAGAFTFPETPKKADDDDEAAPAVSPSAKHLIRSILQPDVCIRITLERAREHLWVTGRGIICSPSPAITASTSSSTCEEESGAESEAPRPSSPSPIWVERHVDYSSKYGLAYVLNNGDMGVYFNDATKLIWMPASKQRQREEDHPGSDGDDVPLMYVAREHLSARRRVDRPKRFDSLTHATRWASATADRDLTKKLKLFRYFAQHMEISPSLPQQPLEQEADPASSQTTEDDVPPPRDSDDNNETSSCCYCYVRNWRQSRECLFFQLSNGDSHFAFRDGAHMLVSERWPRGQYLFRERGTTSGPARKIVVPGGFEAPTSSSTEPPEKVTGLPPLDHTRRFLERLRCVRDMVLLLESQPVAPRGPPRGTGDGGEEDETRRNQNINASRREQQLSPTSCDSVAGKVTTKKLAKKEGRRKSPSKKKKKNSNGGSTGGGGSSSNSFDDAAARSSDNTMCRATLETARRPRARSLG